MSRMMKKAESSKWARNVVAVVTALSLVFMQTPVTWAVADQNANSARSVATNLEEEIAQVGATEVGVSFDHAYIVYNDQVVAEPATKMVVPENAELAFQVEPDNGYEVSSVRLMAGGAEQELTADANGVYRVATEKLTADALISVSASISNASGIPAVVVADDAVIEPIEAEPEASEDEAVQETARDSGKKPVEFSYSDDDVEVTAMLTSADALPEGAKLVVTPITAKTEGYNYDAYMDALSKSDSEVTFTAENTLLYDIAFIVDGVEVQPAEGSVKIDIQFKNKQLTDELKTEDGSDVAVVHLPLKDEVKGAVDSTADATDITAKDIQVEAVGSTTTVAGGEQKTEFTANSFSTYAMVVVPAQSQTSLMAAEASAAAEGDIVVSFDKVGNAATAGPTGNYYLFAVLEKSDGKYFAVTNERLDTASGGPITVRPQYFGQGYNANTATYVPGDKVTAILVNGYPNQDWQLAQLMEGGSAGFTTYGDGDTINGSWTVNIEVPKASLTNDGLDGVTSDDVTNSANGTTYNVEIATLANGGSSYESIRPHAYDQYYALVTLKSKTTGNVRGWAVQKFDINSATPTELEFTEFWKAEEGDDEFLTDSVIYYNSSVYDADVRVYHSADNSLDNYVDFRGKKAKVSDNVYGYTPAKTTSENKTTVTFTNTGVTPFVVQVNFDEGGIAFNGDENYYLYVLVTHQSGDKSAGFAPLVTNGDDSFQVLIEDWYKAGTNELKPDMMFTGNEVSVEPFIIRYNGSGNAMMTDAHGNVVGQPSLKGTGNHSATFSSGDIVKGHQFTYAAMERSNNKFAVTDGLFVQNINLSMQNAATNDYNYQSVLGGGVMYGITAETFDQGNHIQSNFAVNNYKGNGKPVEPDLGSAAGVFVLGNATLTNGAQIFMGNSHSGNIIVYAENKNNGRVLQDNRDFVQVIPATIADMKNNMVEPIINHGDNVSAALSTHGATTAPIIFSTGKALIETTGYAPDATIYIDADAIADKLSEGKLAIRKHPNQTIVFNFKGTSKLKLGEYYVQYPNMNGYEAGVTTTNTDFSGLWIKSDTPMSKGAKNNAIDEIAKHIVWNCESVDNAELEMACGMFLFPKDTSKVDVKATSSGWIISDGYVKNSNGEWHSVYGELPDVRTATLMASKRIDGNIPMANQRFVFKFDRYNPATGGWDNVGSVENEGSTASLVVDNLSEGWNIFRIGELRKASGTEGNYSIDGSTIYAAVQYTVGANGNYASVPRYYTSFNAQDFNANAETAPGVSGPLSQATFFNTTTTDRHPTGSIDFNVQKELIGGQLAAGQFEFQLKNSKGEVIETKSCAADGTVDFAAIDYDENDAGKRYTYTINEVAKSGDNIAYDGHFETITVTVRDTGADELEVTAAYDDADGNAENDDDVATFVNTYRATGNVTIELDKKLTGRNLEADEFAFTLKGHGQDQTVKNDASGKVRFSTIEYTTEDVTFEEGNIEQGHRFADVDYTVREVVPGHENEDIASSQAHFGDTLYDNAARTVRVHIVDLGNGTLQTSYSIVGEASASFKNKNEVVSITVSKEWEDRGNQDGKRPDSIEVTLLKNGNPTDQKVTLTGEKAANSWGPVTFENLPKYDDNGSAITYSVSEEQIDGYEKPVVTGSMTDGYTIKNTRTTFETTEVKAEKRWVDNNNAAELRPNDEGVSLQLKADGTNYGTAHVVRPDSNGDWKTEWKNLPKNRFDAETGESVEIAYTVEESGQIDNYTASGPVVEDGVFVITNTLNEGKTQVSVEKEWADDGNHDNVRPTSIKVQLYADNAAEGNPVVLDAKNNWKYTWETLPKYKNGVEIQYRVDETSVPNGYKEEISKDGTKFTIKNTYTSKRTEVEVTKIWDDNENHDNVRPPSIEVALMNGNSQVGDPVILNATNKWHYEWEGLYALDTSGNPITYTVKETKVPEGYTAGDPVSVGGHDGKFAYTITNTHEDEVINVQALKVWDDDENHDGVRPASVKVKLLADGAEVEGSERTLNASNEWKTQWDNQIKYHSGGTPVEYSVVEAEAGTGELDSYDATYGELTQVGENTFGITITNKHDNETTSVQARKAWADEENIDGLRPSTVTLNLLADDVVLEDKQVTVGSNDWSYTWTGLAKYNAGGTPIVYTVKEANVPKFYEDTYSGDMDSIITVTNTHTVEKTTATICKEWADDNNADGKRPQSIRVQLFKDGVAEGDEVSLTGTGNEWSYTWENLPKYKYEDGEAVEIKYSAAEVGTISEYYSTEPAHLVNNRYVVANKHISEKTKVSVQKKWEDATNADGKRPSSVQVQLYADGSPVKDGVVELSADNNWQYTWTDLQKNIYDPENAGPEQGGSRPIVYTVQEVSLPEGYVADDPLYAEGENGSFVYTLTNRYANEKVSVKVHKKEWLDDNNRDGKRPGSVSVQLYADGVAKGDPVVLNADNDWSYTWPNLDKNHYSATAENHSDKVEYTVIETDPGDGYKASYDDPVYDEATKTWTIEVTNSRTPNKAVVSVNKAWDDDNNRDGVRPESVWVQLYADNAPVEGETVELNADNEWAYTWDQLPENRDGAKIQYTVSELDELAGGKTLRKLGYEKPDIKKTSEDSFTYTVTNKRDAELTDVEVTKDWQDDKNHDGKRPASVTLTLRADGRAIDTCTVEADAQGNWKHTFKDLKKYRDGGTKIDYTVSEEETSVPDYEVTPKGLTAINKHDNEKVTIEGEKIWNELGNASNMRPKSVTVVLKADGVQKATAVASEEGNWKYKFEDLDKYRYDEAEQRAVEVVYTVDEEAVDGYVKAISGPTADGKTTITNTLEVGDLQVSKSVEGGQSGKTFSFTVTLSDEKVNGTHGGMTFENGVATVTLGDGGTVTATNLPAGVTYTVTETAAGGYTPDHPELTGEIKKGEVSKASFVNTYKATGVVNFKVSKTLSGRTLNNGEFEFVLKQDGEEKQRVKNNGENVPFEAITLESTGATIEHEYTIEEVNNGLGGVTYDPNSSYTIKVTAVDDRNGNLVVSYSDGYNPETGITFANTYNASAKTHFEVQKALAGMKLTEGQFTFELTGDGIVDENNEPARMVASNGANGRAVFGDITYTQPNTYHYTIAEQHPAYGEVQETTGNWVYNGMSYDGKRVNVTVVVVDNGNGTMTATPSYEIVNGLGEVIATHPETVGEGTATPSADSDEVYAPVFANAYEAEGTFDLRGVKKMSGRAFLPGEEFTFTVTGSEGAPMPANTSVTVTADEDGNMPIIDFGAIQYGNNDRGKTYEYTVTESSNGIKDGVTIDLPHKVQVTVSDNLDANGNLDGSLNVTPTYDGKRGDNATEGVVFTNTYKAEGEALLSVNKKLNGRAIDGSEFSFKLLDKDDKVLQRATVVPDENDKTIGKATFEPIAFDQSDLEGAGPEGKDFEYKIVEVEGDKGGVTYDDHVEKVVIHVTDNGNGTLTTKTTYNDKTDTPLFTNEYKVEAADATIEATKLLAGGEIEEGQFEFKLTSKEGNSVTTNQTKHNDAEGKVVFDKLTFNEPGTYEYEIVESVPPEPVDMGNELYRKNTIVYDGTTHTATVTVTDDGNGHLKAAVVYDKGKPIESNDLKITNGIYLSRTSFEFDKYFFGSAGKFEFLLFAADAQGKARGDNPDRNYTVNADSIVNGVFNQEIVDNGTDAFTITVSNGAFANGRAKVSFPEIKFAADGDYYYVACEKKSDDPNIVTDEAAYLIHVTVSGGEVTDTKYDLLYKGVNYPSVTDLSFYNNSTVKLGFASISAQSYTGLAQKTSVYPEVKKYLNGKTDNLVAGEFAFELWSEDGVRIATATNDEVGNVAFFNEEKEDGLVFTEAGTYRYIIREVPGDQPNVVYDKSEIILTVTVTETIEGLKAEMSYGGAVGVGEEPAFYNSAEGTDLKVQKVSRYGGEGLVECTYALWMVGANGDVMIQEATSDANGYILFENVNLMKGVKYYFKEVEAPAGHTVDPYRTAYFSLNEEGTDLVLVEETAADGWHSKYDNIELDKARKASEGSE